ncbi:MAG TPA: pilus assembly protein TadG-related protein [Vicinamibacterales bacterium]|nr:pilus assembly protein TadG-related protein [Vicinamibacterales bacterium]
MTTTVRARIGGEDGAILVHVAVALLMLIALSAFAIDFGLFWLGRSEAQNAADAGALAGAVALNFDSTDTSDAGPAKLSALKAAQSNLVVGEAPSIDVSTDINFVDCPDGTPSPACIRVDAYRDTAHGNPLPMWFGNIVGLVSQDTKATATAEAAAGNGTNCLRPWMIPDKWKENTAPATTFNGADVYTAPDPKTGLGGTGYTVKNDYGTVVTLHPGDPKKAIAPSDFYAINLTDSAGGNDYRTNIGTCINETEAIGDVLTVKPGNMVGPTKQGVGDLVAEDPGASWNGKKIVGSAYAVSPRIVPIAMFSPADFMAQDRQSGVFDLKIVNMLGFFVQGVSGGGDVTGVLISLPGELVTTGGKVGPGASFLKITLLVR